MAPANTTGTDLKCTCAAGYGMTDAKTCEPCKDNTYKAAVGAEKCTECESGKSAALENGTVSTAGPNT